MSFYSTFYSNCFLVLDFFYLAILITSVRCGYVPSRFHTVCSSWSFWGTAWAEIASQLTPVSKRLKWDCVFSLCLHVFLILRRAVNYVKKRYRSGDSPVRSTFHLRIPAQTRLHPRNTRCFLLRRTLSFCNSDCCFDYVSIYFNVVGWERFEIK